MSSHPFDTVTRAMATMSRRSLLRWLGATTLGSLVTGVQAQIVTATNRFPSGVGRPASRREIHQFGPPLPPLPPAEPWSFDNPPNLDDIINDYLDCVTQGRTPEECDQGFPGFAPFDWCQLVWDVLTEAMPTLAGLASTFTPFSRNCGERDCFQCCYVGRTGGCGSSYIGFPVINCNTGTYGEGTKAVGLTFIVDPDSVEPGDSCLFIPQLCTHIAQCVKTETAVASGDATMGNDAVIQLQHATAEDYLTHPRAVDQRARYFAMRVQEDVRAYLETYTTSTPDARPLHSLVEALTNRGHAGWRRELTNTPIDITNPAIRINDAAGNLNESASWINAAQLLGLARVMTGVPNLAARLAHVESRKWTQVEKDTYLAGMSDPSQALQSTLDPHWITILQRLQPLQDYALLAVPLEGETGLEEKFGGQTLGQAPLVSLRATTVGAEVTLTIGMEDGEDVAGGLPRPIAVDWGDGHATHHSLPSGQPAMDVTHAYAAAGRYAIYAVAGSDSGLRGHAALVVETSAPTSTSPSTVPTISRVHLSGFALTNWLSTKRFSVEARLVDAAGQGFRAGRGALGNGSSKANVPFAFGDLYAHNPARFDTSVISLTLRNELAGPASRVFVLHMTMAATMTLGVFATVTQQLVEHTVALTPEMLKLYLAGATTPMPSDTVTVEATGALHIPLFWRAASNEPWQKIVRIDIELTAAMFDGFTLNQTALEAPVGTHRTWIETRPRALVEVQSTQSQVLMPFIVR